MSIKFIRVRKLCYYHCCVASKFTKFYFMSTKVKQNLTNKVNNVLAGGGEITANLNERTIKINIVLNSKAVWENRRLRSSSDRVNSIDISDKRPKGDTSFQI